MHRYILALSCLSHCHLPRRVEDVFTDAPADLKRSGPSLFNCNCAVVNSHERDCRGWENTNLAWCSNPPAWGDPHTEYVVVNRKCRYFCPITILQIVC